MRLILPLNGGLPFQEYQDKLGQALPPLETAVEISRLIIRPDFRQSTSTVPTSTAAELEAEAGLGNSLANIFIQMCMFRLLIQVSAAMGLTHWFAHMEEKLALSLRKKSMVFEPVGPSVEWPNGLTRLTFMADLAKLHSFWDRSKKTSAQFLRNSLAA